jgi:hypothetical protein
VPLDEIARRAGVLRSDFRTDDLATLVWAMSKVIAGVWR